MTTENKKLFIYVDGLPKGLNSESAEVKFKSIALQDRAGVWFDLAADTNADGTITFSNLNLVNVGTINGRDIDADGAKLDDHIAGTTEAYKHAVEDITGLTSALGSKANASSVTPNTYTKLTVNAQGIVTAGAQALTSDISGLDTALGSKAEAQSVPAGTYTKITLNAQGVATGAAQALTSDISGLDTALGSKANAQNVTPGSYTKITLNAQGVATGAAQALTSDISGLDSALGSKADAVSASAGSYSKVTINGQGIVTSGSQALVSDISGLDSALSAKANAASVAAGDYVKVTVNAQGIVTAGSSSIAQSEVTGLEAAISDLSTFDSDLALTTAGKGASMIGVEDAAGKFTATDVEAALAEAMGAAEAAQGTASAALPKAGGTMSGAINMGSQKITDLGAPTLATDAATKGYVDTAIMGLDFQADVLAVQVDATLDPGTPVSGARYLITNAAALHANFGTISGVANGDIVEYSGSAFAVVYDVSAAGEGAVVWDRATNTYYNYDGSAWSQFGGLAGVTAGTGLVKSGNTLSINLGAGIAELPSDEVGVDLKSDGGLYLADPTTGNASSASDAQIAVKLDGTTLSKSASGLKLGSGAAGAGLVSESDGSLRSKANVIEMYAAESLVAGDIVIASTTEAGKVLRADASAIASCEGVVGVVTVGGNAADTVKIQVSGEVTVGNGGTGFSLGKRVFVSETIGQGTATAPTATDTVVYMIGVATASNKVVLQPSLVVIN